METNESRLEKENHELKLQIARLERALKRMENKVTWLRAEYQKWGIKVPPFNNP
jgi:prefoldin subunit 5